MYEFIVSVKYFPIVFGKEKTYRITTELSREELCEKIREIEEKRNENYTVYVYVDTVEEYINTISKKNINDL